MDTINFLNFLQPLMDPLTNPYAPDAGASREGRWRHHRQGLRAGRRGGGKP